MAVFKREQTAYDLQMKLTQSGGSFSPKERGGIR